MLSAKNLSVNIDGKQIIKDIDISLKENDFLMIVGPNGSGKTTIVRSLMGDIPSTGEVLLFGKDIKNMNKKKLAKKIGVLMQNHFQQFSFTVEEVVSLGRYSYQEGLFPSMSKTDKEKVADAIDKVGLNEFKNRSILSLSGGELQRTFLAQLFAQEPDILVLDEPTNHLDITYQIELFELIKKWSEEEGKAVISIVHDLNLAFQYGTKAILLKNGEVYSKGGLKEVLSNDNLKDVYKVDIKNWMQQIYKYWI